MTGAGPLATSPAPVPPSALCGAVLLLALLPAPGAAREGGPPVQLETVAGEREGTLDAVDLGDPATLTLSGESVPLTEVLRIRLNPPARYRRELEVTLADGARLLGGLGLGSTGTHLDLNGRLFPDGIRVPLEWVRRIDHLSSGEREEEPPGAPRAALLDAAAESDRVYTRQGATLEGIVEKIESKGIVLEDRKLGRIQLAWEKVRTILIAPLGPPPDPAGSPRVVFEGVDGSRIPGVLTRLDAAGGSAALSSPLLGSITLPVARLHSVEFLFGRVAYLSDREVAKVEEGVPYTEIFPWTWQRDRSVLGSPLTIGARTFRRGLGVHSRSKLTFPLEEGDRRFQSWIGIDRSGRPLDGNTEVGSVLFRVIVDGEERFRSEEIGWQDPALRIDIPVAGGKELELVVEMGKGFHILDRADWGDARILRD